MGSSASAVLRQSDGDNMWESGAQTPYQFATVAHRPEGCTLAWHRSPTRQTDYPPLLILLLLVPLPLILRSCELLFTHSLSLLIMLGRLGSVRLGSVRLDVLLCSVCDTLLALSRRRLRLHAQKLFRKQWLATQGGASGGTLAQTANLCRASEQYLVTSSLSLHIIHGVDRCVSGIILYTDGTKVVTKRCRSALAA
jgi:hypothetical protein